MEKENEKKAGMPLTEEEELERETEITEIMLSLDPERYPETCELFAEHERDNEMNGYELAARLMECDRTMPMTDEVFSFVVTLLEDCVADGDEDAMNDLGALYYEGRNGKPDFEKAVYYYEMAAKAGSRQAEENLGYCWYYGRTGKKDYAKAFHYFLLGALDGHLISLYKVGDMYRNGLYVEKNPKEAFRIYNRCLETMTKEAADRVCGPVCLRMGQMLLDGEGCEPDAEAALYAFQRAELYLFDMVKAGDDMYRKSWEQAVVGQEEARSQLKNKLPDANWTADD